MKRIFFLLLAGSLLPSCSTSSAIEPNVNTSGTPANIVQNNANANVDYGRGFRNYEDLMKKQRSLGNETSAAKPVPAAFRNVDFDNLDYPEIGEKFTIRLRKGKYNFESSKHCDWREYTSGALEFPDFDSDGKPEALVTLNDHSGCASSGVEELFYLYTMSKDKPRLLWSFETGSQSQCGLQNSEIKDSKLTIEVIGDCNYRHKRLFNNDTASDIEAYNITRFVFGWKASEFQQLSREVIPLP